jgi:phospholipid transport system transporter-binding protein
MDNASPTLADGLRAIDAGQFDFDLSGLTGVDSSAVAILLQWQRQARQRGATLTLIAVPSNLQSLIDLYGVADLLAVPPIQPYHSSH